MKLATLIVSAMALGTSFAASPSYWNANGSGSWASESRWENGNVPQPGYQVRLTGATYANDGDMAILAAAGQVVLPGYSSVFTISNDVDATISVPFAGEGKVVKLGKGTLTLDWKGEYTRFANLGMWEVRDGILLETSTYEMRPKSPQGVYTPGVLAIAYDMKLPGIVGDGIVSNASAAVRTLYITAGSSEKPSVFSGTFAGEKKFAYKDQGGGQQLTNPAAVDMISSVEMQAGDIVGYFGFGAPPPVQIICRQSSIFEYLGSGASTGSDNIMFNNETWCVEYGAGPTGGLTFNNVIKMPGDKYGVVELVLSGSNTTACTFAGTFSGVGSNIKAVYVKKAGTGRWNFTSSSKSNYGTVEVEKGTLGYASIAERGTSCSLGSAARTQSEYTGAYDESKMVPYAYLLGDGTVPYGVDETVATMLYTGSAAAVITNRAVVLRGAGRFASESAVLNWTGFTSAVDAENQLILAGAVDGCVARGVSNGVGTVSVAKEGSGSWTLAGDLDFSGSLEARAGTLSVAQRYHWYKIIFKETWKIPRSGTDDALMTRGIGLFADGSNAPYTNIAWNASAVGNPATLAPGQACLGRAGYSTQSGREPINFFRNTSLAQVSYSKTLVLTNSATWIEVIVRLPEDAAPIVRYDIRAANGGGQSTPYFREAYSWSMQGSCDGIVWDELHTVISNKTTSGATASKYSQSNWYSSGGSTPTGWAVRSAPEAPAALAAVVAVGAAEGATLRTDTAVTAGGIVYDAALGGGTINGFAFSSDCTLELRNMPSGATTLPIVLTNCTGVGEARIRSVTINGKTKQGWSAVLSEAGITVFPGGTCIIIK